MRPFRGCHCPHRITQADVPCPHGGH
jgi:hypothetical protein